MKRVLITGITGFVGSHMADYILENVPGAEIYGIKRWRSREENIFHLDFYIVHNNLINLYE